jgi:MYXO-CTERM domain-containing protein
MATARSRDSSGSLSYFTRFSWRVFGITAGAEQVGFANGEDSRHVLNYSGLLVANDISFLDGLGAVGDRADKLTLTFDYGSVEPDVALTKVTGKDYREVIEVVSYVPCYDGGTDSAIAPPPPDGGADTARTVDTAVRLDGLDIVYDAIPIKPTDVAVVVTPDAATDSYVPPQYPPEGRSDAGAIVVPDSAIATPDSAVLVKLDAPAVVTTPDAAVAPTDARSEPPPTKHGGGCSVAGGMGDVAPLLIVGILVGLARRRRRR